MLGTPSPFDGPSTGQDGTLGGVPSPTDKPHRGRILVVEDEPAALQALGYLLADEGYEVAQAVDGEEASGLAEGFGPDLVLADLKMPRLDGLGLLRRLRELGLDVPVVVMTAHGTVQSAVEAMKLGAVDYLTKPLNMDETLLVLARALERRRLEQEATRLRERLRGRAGSPQVVGASAEMQAVFDLARKAAQSRATVLLLGESGTGKEVIAQAIHEGSPRADKPFIKVSCAALPESLLESELFGHERGAFTGATARRQGRFELADGGTLFLDEIGEISPLVQVKLLRVLQGRQFERVGGTETLTVDARIVAATNRDLGTAVREGHFREDLFFRLNVISIELPPLRARKTDIPPLADHFLRRCSAAYGKPPPKLSPEAFALLLRYDWPGNVRELENAIERAVVLTEGPEIGPEVLPPALLGRAPGARQLIPGARLAEIEREAILRTLEVVGGSTARAAELLGISVRTIQYRLKEYEGLDSAQKDR